MAKSEITSNQGGTEPARPVLRFYIALSWDAHRYVNYFVAPDGWEGMSDEGRQRFLSEEAMSWMEEHVEYGADVYDPEGSSGSSVWESGGDPDEPEERF